MVWLNLSAQFRHHIHYSIASEHRSTSLSKAYQSFQPHAHNLQCALYGISD